MSRQEMTQLAREAQAALLRAIGEEFAKTEEPAVGGRPFIRSAWSPSEDLEKAEAVARLRTALQDLREQIDGCEPGRPGLSAHIDQLAGAWPWPGDLAARVRAFAGSCELAELSPDP